MNVWFQRCVIFLCTNITCSKCQMGRSDQTNSVKILCLIIWISHNLVVHRKFCGPCTLSFLINYHNWGKDMDPVGHVQLRQIRTRYASDWTWMVILWMNIPFVLPWKVHSHLSCSGSISACKPYIFSECSGLQLPQKVYLPRTHCGFTRELRRAH